MLNLFIFIIFYIYTSRHFNFPPFFGHTSKVVNYLSCHPGFGGNSFDSGTTPSQSPFWRSSPNTRTPTMRCCGAWPKWSVAKRQPCNRENITFEDFLNVGETLPDVCTWAIICVLPYSTGLPALFVGREIFPQCFKVKIIYKFYWDTEEILITLALISPSY